MEAFILLVVLILVNAAFACAEIAVISVSDTKLKKMSDDGDKRAKRLLDLTDQPAKFLATIQVAITFAGLLQSAFAAENFAGPLVKILVDMGVGVPENILKTASIVVITIVLAYFTLVFGELVPKRIGMKKAESIALGMSGVLYWVAKLAAPIVWFLTVSTNIILRILRINPEEEEDAVTEEEIKMMLAEGKERGTIPSEENQLIQNVFEFNDITAEELCTHRREVVALSTDDTVEEWDSIIKESRFSRYPICGDRLDDIIGVLDIKDYYRCANKSIDFITNTIVKKVMLVPESMKANTLFNKMRENREHFAVVIDEYGGLSGVISIYDIFEVIFGDFNEDESTKPFDIEIIDETTWKIDGLCDLDDAAEALKTSMPVDTYSTFSGFICGIIGRIPDEGESFTVTWKDMEIQVLGVKNHIIESAVVRIIK